ncbi:uncharacterized protein LOC121273336 isoform X1 [Carcharodon carcharias]|uniref:uncharacterized protein LOC121273336 isoform X1 n=2 Tax=Carcharodon carcharias TaxID=13397 RepID=UPI001B7F2B27|nr:uncharacterized protein LOC121273336 isoform X1 [Carcharodon carcharias]
MIKPSRICQLYENKYHFATAYSTTLRIPLYSAYKRSWLGDPRGNRPQDYFIEPQLDLPGGSNEMSTEPEDGVGMNQALNSDYRNQSYHRGHLYPFSFNTGSSTATCTLTNIVPKTPKMNRNWFHNAEKLLKQMPMECPEGTTLFVITGVVPSFQFLNNRVNIPLMVYSYFSCCSEEIEEKAARSGGYILRLDTKVPVVETVTLAKLQELLGSSIEVNPKWAKVSVSENELDLLEVINEILKSSWPERLSNILTALFDAVSFITMCVYGWVACVIHWVFRVIYGVVRVVLGAISAVIALVNLLLAAGTYLIWTILGLIGGICWIIGAPVIKGFLSVADSLLSLVTSATKFLLTSIASIPTYIISFITNLITLLSSKSFSLLLLFSFLLPTFSSLVSLFSLFSGATFLIAIWPDWILSFIHSIIKLTPSVAKTHAPPRNTYKWSFRVIPRDLMSKLWSAISGIPPPWKMFLAIVSFLPSLLLGGWGIAMNVLGSLFFLVTKITFGIFGTIATAVLGLEALVIQVLQTIGKVVSVCITGPSWIFTTLIPRLFQYLVSYFSKYPVYASLILVGVLLICCLQVLTKFFSFSRCSVALKPGTCRCLVTNQLEQTPNPPASVSNRLPSIKCSSQISVQPNTKRDNVKVYFSYAKGLCVENAIPILVIVLGVCIDNTISSPFLYGGIRLRTVGVAVAVLVSVLTDGTNPRYSRALLITAFAAGVVVIHNVITYFITGVYKCICTIFTNIGLITLLAISMAVGLMMANGDDLDSFVGRISASLPTSLNAAFLSTATGIREAIRNRSPILVSLLVIIFNLLIQSSDPLKDIVTEFLQVIFFAGVLIALALVIKESINLPSGRDN